VHGIEPSWMIFAILAGAFGALASFTSKEATSAGLVPPHHLILNN
jgi:uncharacterized membrane protein